MPGRREAVTEYLARTGLPIEVRVFDGSTRNSAVAAKEIGCRVEQIAKSIVFVGKKTVVVVISGDLRVDAGRLEKEVGAPVRVATPDEAKEATGYPVGGVPTFPHRAGVDVLIDVSLNRFEEVWAAAGTANAIFRIRTKDLAALVGKEPVSLSRDS